MELFTFARALHVLAVIVWIGGVAMVTWVILPAVKRFSSKEKQIQTFEAIEGRFAFIAKIATVVTGLSGFLMLHILNGWDRYFQIKYWWVHAMTLVWLLFSIILFILEPFVLHKVFKHFAHKNPERTFNIMQKAHWLLLTISLITVLGSVLGSHGYFFFD